MVVDVARAPDLYAGLRSIALPVLRRLTGAQATTAVAACPGWAVKDVVAHVSGLVAETLAGVPLPRGSDEATARQVADRATWSLARICDEWMGNADAFGTYGATDPAYVAALTADLVVHCHDIEEALDMSFGLDDDAVLFVAVRYASLLQERALDRASVALAVNLGSAELLSAEPAAARLPVVTLTVNPQTFLRSVTGRRTRSFVADLDWSGDPARLLDTAWSQYAPLVD